MKQSLKVILFNILFISTAYSQNGNMIDKLILEQNYNDAINLLENNLDDKSSYDDYYKLGFLYSEIFENEKAIVNLRKAYSLNSTDMKSIFLLGKLLSERGDYKESITVYSEALRSDSGNIRLLNNLASAYVNYKNYDKALKIYRRLFEIDSTNLTNIRKLASLLLLNDKFNESLSFLEKAYSIDSLNVENLYDLIIVKFKQKKYEEAMDYAYKGMRRDFENLKINRIAAEIAFQQKLYFFAKEKFQKVIAGGDSSAMVLQKIGISNYFIGYEIAQDTNAIAQYYSDAVTYLKRSFELAKEDQATNLYLGLTYKAQGNHDSAVVYFENYVNLLFPEYLTDVYFNLAGSYIEVGKIRDALEVYDEIIELKPDKNYIYYFIGFTYDKYISDKKNALKYYEIYLNSGDKSNPSLLSYAESRRDKIKEELFFKGELN